MSSPNKRPRGLMKSKKAADGDNRAPKRQKKRGKETPETVAANSDVMMQDWDDLKELFENAFKVYEGPSRYFYVRNSMKLIHKAIQERTQQQQPHSSGESSTNAIDSSGITKATQLLSTAVRLSSHRNLTLPSHSKPSTVALYTL